MRLPRELIHAAPFAGRLRFDLSPVQLGLDGSPWHVAVTSIMLQRCARVPHVISEVFRLFPTPEYMEASDTELQHYLQPLGLHRTRARYIQQLSRRWHTDTWSDLRDLNGVGDYVADAVALFCFGNTQFTCNDGVLHAYAAEYSGPSMQYDNGRWMCDDTVFSTPAEAYSEYRARKTTGQAQVDGAHHPDP